MSEVIKFRQAEKDERVEKSNGSQMAGYLIGFFAIAAVIWEANSFYDYTINNPDPEEIAQDISVSVENKKLPRPKPMGFVPVRRTASAPAPSF